MSSKTKIVVLHMKEVIYTFVFLALAIILGILLYMMFGSRGKGDTAAEKETTQLYTAGVYTTPITLSGNTFDVEVTVDTDHINEIRLVNLSESTTAMYPLMQPTLEQIAAQVRAGATPEEISFEADNKYTSLLLLEAIDVALDKARIK